MHVFNLELPIMLLHITVSFALANYYKPIGMLAVVSIMDINEYEELWGSPLDNRKSHRVRDHTGNPIKDSVLRKVQ